MLIEIADFGLPEPRVGHVFNMDDMHDAIRLFKSGRTTGKVIVVP